jgi:hypothetical protein
MAGKKIADEKELEIRLHTLDQYVNAQLVRLELPYHVSVPTQKGWTLKKLVDAARPQGLHFPELYEEMKRSKTLKRARDIFQQLLHGWENARAEKRYDLLVRYMSKPTWIKGFQEYDPW